MPTPPPSLLASPLGSSMATDGSRGFSDLVITRGHIFVYRVFDVAEEIRLKEVEALLMNNGGPERFKVPKFIDRALVVKNPPIAWALGERTLRVGERNLKCEVLAKIRDFGAVSLIFQIGIQSGLRWSELITLAAELEEGGEIDDEANRILPEVLGPIRAAVVAPTHSDLFEDYIIYYVEEFATPIRAIELMTKVDVPALLLAEHEISLSESARGSATENVFQYGEGDLTVVEWNAALVVDPSGGREIPDILEFAVSQLLEMRYYDDLLDRRLQELYDKIEAQKKRIFSGGRFDQLYRESSSRFIEFTEFIERIENSLKVVGDFYLATVYRSANRKFRITDWQNSVTRKINILGQVSSLLQGEVNSRRSYILEWVVAILILYEVLTAVWRH